MSPKTGLCGVWFASSAFCLVGAGMSGQLHAQSSDAPPAAATSRVAATPAKPSKAQLEEVVVTATRTGATALQKTPIAIAAYSGKQLSTRGVNNLNDLTTLSPNIELTDISGQSSLFIRGIGTNNGGYVGSDPSSTLQIDGVYISRALAYNLDFLDVERVEVLRGPQGTLYGRNAVGGTINIISRQPTTKPTAEIQVSGGTFGEFGADAYVSGPIGNSGVLGSIAYEHTQHDPYLKNVSTGNSVQSDDTDAARAQLLIPLGTDVKLTLRADFTHKSWAIPAFPKQLAQDGVPLDESIFGDYTKVALNRHSHADEVDGGASAQLDYKLSDNISIKSLTAFRADRGRLDYDPDGSSLDILRSVTDPSVESQFSEEFNITAKYDRLTLVTGAYYYLENFTDPLWVAIYPAQASSFRFAALTDSAIAGYGQAEYKLTDSLSLTAGLRYTNERKHLRADLFYTGSPGPTESAALSAPIIGAPFFPDQFRVDTQRTDGAFTPKFGINYQAAPNVLLYASATRGFKSGGYAIGAPDGPDLAAGYAPEYLWAYEGGLKADWFERRLRTNASVFHYDFSNLQVTTEKPPIGEVTKNAGVAKIDGIEYETQFRPIPPLMLYGNVAYLDAHYASYADAYVTEFGIFNAANKRLNDAPRFAFSVGASYDLDFNEYGDVAVGTDYRWQSTVYYSPANEGVGAISNYPEQQAPYGLLNAHATWTSADGKYTASLIGRNLTDSHYVTATATFGVAISGLPGDPRTVMVQLARRW